MKSEPAQLPVPPPRKNAEKSKKSPKTTLDPKNAQLFIENFVNQVKIKNVIYNFITPIVIPKTTFYAILMLIASYLSPAVFLHFLKKFWIRFKNSLSQNFSRTPSIIFQRLKFNFQFHIDEKFSLLTKLFEKIESSILNSKNWKNSQDGKLEKIKPQKC